MAAFRMRGVVEAAAPLILKAAADVVVFALAVYGEYVLQVVAKHK